MSLPPLSQKEFYDLVIANLQDNAPDLTDTNEGSLIDITAGSMSIAAVEITKIIIDQFNKCFIDLAQGPDENDGGPDDLQTLAVDHFGDKFARPQAVAAIDTVTFSRPTNGAGAGLIPAGTVVKTKPDANGQAQRYTTNVNANLTNAGSGAGLSTSVGVTAVVAGSAGDALSGTIVVIESTLFDSTIVVTNIGNATGRDAETSPEYRDTIHNLIQALAGATIAAVQAAAKSVPGIQTATAIEQVLKVKLYDPNTDTVSGLPFSIPKPTLYVADATGTASPTLLQAVRIAIDLIRAGGVMFDVAAAVATLVNWTVSVTLNPSGPNYSTFSVDLNIIRTAMKDYINALPIGTSFVRANAEAAILAIYGVAGTDDITAFVTSVPSGDVSASVTTKMIAGTMSTS